MSDIEKYLNSIENDTRRKDSDLLIPIMQRASGYKPWLAGTMIGFGEYHYQYSSGREGDWFVTGFAPRKQNLAIYIMPGFDNYQSELKSLGKFKTGKSCLYINKLTDINLTVLEDLISMSVKEMQSKYPCKEK